MTRLVFKHRKFLEPKNISEEKKRSLKQEIQNTSINKAALLFISPDYFLSAVCILIGSSSLIVCTFEKKLPHFIMNIAAILLVWSILQFMLFLISEISAYQSAKLWLYKLFPEFKKTNDFFCLSGSQEILIGPFKEIIFWLKKLKSKLNS